MRLLFLVFLLLYTVNGFCQKQILLIGTYDSPKSEGIYVFEFNGLDGSVKELSHVKTSNSSYIAISPNKKYVYAVNENANITGKGGSVTSFLFDKKSGNLKKINTQSSQGNHPCYISVDKTGKWIVTGNYSSGNFAVLPVNKNGELQPASQIIQHYGKSIDTARQNSPHVHTTVISKNNKSLYVTDLGTDKIMIYGFDGKTGKVTASSPEFILTPAGSGPRHLDISPDNMFLYVLQEMSGNIVLYSLKNKSFNELQTISNLPANFKGAAGSADIHISPDGNFLYASNRGQLNTIVIYKINKITGHITFVSLQSTLGLGPRNFNFDLSGKYLLVANQNSNEVVIFKRNIKTGLLSDTGNRISVGKPVCLKWL